MRRLISLALALAFLTLTLNARTILVPQDYTTIAAAIDTAISGDSIVVGPGTYDSPPPIIGYPNNITLIGNGFLGENRTTIIGVNEVEGKIDLRQVKGWEVGGFEMTGGKKGVNTYQTNGVYIHDIYVHNVSWWYADGVMVNGNFTMIERCIFAHMPYAGIEVWYPDQSGLVFRNNTIVRSANGILVRGQTSNLVVENNIITNCGTGVEFTSSFTGSELLDYNDVWNNTSNWSECTPGSHNISANPQFMGGNGAEKYMLMPNSPCIDAGDPSTPLDPDGTISDIGAFPYDQTEPQGTCTIILTPVGLPIVLPPSGGTIVFAVSVINSPTNFNLFDVWLQMTEPDSSITQIAARNSLFLQPSQQINKLTSLTFSAAAQAGTYTISGYVGDNPLVIEDFDSFTFVKQSGADQGAPYTAATATFTGWDNEEVIHLSSAVPELASKLSLAPTLNPFNPETVLEFTLPQAGDVSLKVFDISGRLVQTLYDRPLDAGNHAAHFNGSQLASGVYFAVLQAQEQTVTTRLLLLK
jgi:hypothetical protein